MTGAHKAQIAIYYHDPVEVDPKKSWTGLSTVLDSATRVDISRAFDSRVTALFAYARPDAVITLDGVPVVSIEQTAMNPSGHNIPQRFSFHLCAAELGVPSVLYYPEYARRTFSDPGVRYVQVRVPLAQERLSKIYGVPALSAFWPTDPATKLPQTGRSAHLGMARLVEELVTRDLDADPMALPQVQRVLGEMRRTVLAHEKEYRANPSIRAHFPSGLSSSRTLSGRAIDPPHGLKLHRTADLLDSSAYLRGLGAEVRAVLEHRELTLVYTGTANAGRTDSEHPWPGYLTLFDALYARLGNAKSPTGRHFNLIYRLPNVPAKLFIARAERPKPPTATFIVDTFADLVLLDSGVHVGAPLRNRL